MVHSRSAQAERRACRVPVFLVVAGLAAVMMAGCAAPGEPDTTAREGYAPVEDLYIVDCLLPGQVRRLGNTQYLTPRRPIRTTAGDCRVRGGEYVSYDRADYPSALKVWMERAEAGDAEAQNYVGEIFEKGLGKEPDYVSAATWYRRAAEHGNSRAQTNLGYLYEQGLGVEQDTALALNWYRRASGVSEDDLVFRSEYDERIEALRSDLDEQIEETGRQVDALRTQLARLRSERDALRQRLDEAETAAAAAADGERGSASADEDRSARAAELEAELASARGEIATLEGLYAQVNEDREALTEKLTELPKQRSVAPALEPEAVELPAQASATLDGIDFGRFYALIIGNRDYQYLDDLASPIDDAERVRDILEDRYGFSAVFLPNANEQQILNALDDLYEQIRPEDNLLIYYAGHGSLSERDESRRRGYWLPVDAREDRLVRWINNSVISDHLDRIRARSILVVADSCYAGALASESSALLLGSAAATLTEESIRSGLGRRARVVISSGGVRPVLDAVDGKHSTFAQSLIEVLENNDRVLRENMLFARVAVNVRRRSEGTSLPQTPEMRPIRAAGHEGGDFYFVPSGDGAGS